MKANRWWLRQINLKTFRKWHHSIGQYGSYFNLDKWDEIITELRAVKPGTKMFNCFTGNYSEIASIEFEWESCSFDGWRIKTDTTYRKGPPGSAVFSFLIHCTDGYILRDSPSDAEFYKQITLDWLASDEGKQYSKIETISNDSKKG